MARSYMVERYGKAAYKKGYSVFTTIDSTNQAAANVALRDGLIAYDQRHGYRGVSGAIGVNGNDSYFIRDALSQYPTVGGLRPVAIIDIGLESINVLILFQLDRRISCLLWLTSLQ